MAVQCPEDGQTVIIDAIVLRTRVHGKKLLFADVVVDSGRRPLQVILSQKTYQLGPLSAPFNVLRTICTAGTRWEFCGARSPSLRGEPSLIAQEARLLQVQLHGPTSKSIF